MPGPDRENVRKINDNEIESQKRTEESQGELEPRRGLPVWQWWVLLLQTRTLQLLLVRLQEVTCL
jgi:hypothetical protein